LFLTLFLRGRSSRGLKTKHAPKSVGEKLGLILGLYAALGLLAFLFWGQSIFALSVYLHAMTFVFLGMFVASSAGEILFNADESDILLHRPINSSTLLWAKVRVLIDVSLWLAGAFNLAGLIAGFASPQGNWRFPCAHIVSTILEALFCTGCVVMIYQLCLRWFGRERVEGLMTTSQVIISVAAVLSGQLLPQLMFRAGKMTAFNENSWWIALLPPAWFAGFDDALAGSASRGSWILAALALFCTVVVVWIAFGKLSQDYESGLQKMAQSTTRRPLKEGRRRWIEVLVDTPPLRWWLGDSVARASFLLTAAYLLRDRDVKLRIYPALAPLLVMPIVMMAPGLHANAPGTGGFGIAFTGAFLAVIPMMSLNLLQYSQQWQAADIFRAAPMLGPASLLKGARRAILCLMAIPGTVVLATLVWLLSAGHRSDVLLLLPGLILVPVFALFAKGVPLSMPVEEAKAASRGLSMMGATFGAIAISGAALWAWLTGWFWVFLLIEVSAATVVYFTLQRSLAQARWMAAE
jgi:hypothetical protein